MNDHFSISIVVPVLNEEDSLEIFYKEITDALKVFSEWEIIFIDDGSGDESNNIIKRLADNDERITLIQFFKNFGNSNDQFLNYIFLEYVVGASLMRASNR